MMENEGNQEDWSRGQAVKLVCAWFKTIKQIKALKHLNQKPYFTMDHDLQHSHTSLTSSQQCSTLWIELAAVITLQRLVVSTTVSFATRQDCQHPSLYDHTVVRRESSPPHQSHDQRAREQLDGCQSDKIFYVTYSKWRPRKTAQSLSLAISPQVLS